MIDVSNKCRLIRNLFWLTLLICRMPRCWFGQYRSVQQKAKMWSSMTEGSMTIFYQRKCSLRKLVVEKSLRKSHCVLYNSSSNLEAVSQMDMACFRYWSDLAGFWISFAQRRPKLLNLEIQKWIDGKWMKPCSRTGRRGSADRGDSTDQ